MEKNELSLLQQEILKALETLGEKSRYSEAVLAKKIRENAKIDGKKKAGISLNDIEKAVSYLEAEKQSYYAVIMNSANDLLIEKVLEPRPLSSDARTRRLRSEKSMCIFTNSDLNSRKPLKKKQSTRNRREHFNGNVDIDSLDE